MDCSREVNYNETTRNDDSVTCVGASGEEGQELVSSAEID